MRYFLVDSEATAAQLSELVYIIMFPDSVSVETKYLFGWHTGAGGTAICIPENFACPVFVKDNFDTVIDTIKGILTGDGVEGEVEALVSYLQTGSIYLHNIIPSEVAQYEVDRQYLIDNKIIKIADI
jgi:hypothetical protein